MRILIAADIFPPQSGGPATYAVMLSSELVKLGVEVEIVSLNPDSDSAQVKCRLYAVKNGNKLKKYFQYFWFLLARGKKADVIYAMGPVNAGVPAMAVSMFLKKKFVVKVVGDYAWEQGVQRFGVTDGIDQFQINKNCRWQVKVLKFLQAQVCKKANLVVVPSKYLAGMVKLWGVVESRVKVIYNSIDFKFVSAAEKPQNEKWIVTVGRLVPWKGITELIEVMPEIKQIYPNAKLIIVGDGPDMDRLREKVVKQNLVGSVNFLGKKSREEALSVIAAADVFVLNSGYEGLSHVLLEATALKVPVLASNMGGNSEVATGHLFELNNLEEMTEKILSVLGQEKFSITKYDIDKEFADRFSLQKMITQTVQAIFSL